MRVGEHADGVYVDTDSARLDLDRLHDWLSTDAYWALGRSRAQLDRAIAGSDCYGLYDPDDRQVGFTRVITDSTTFAWLCDVYVDRSVRGRGYGTWLVRTVCAHLAESGPRRILLATADAHGVYEKIGFAPLRNPERWMELLRPER